MNHCIHMIRVSETQYERCGAEIESDRVLCEKHYKELAQKYADKKVWKQGELFTPEDLQQ